MNNHIICPGENYRFDPNNAYIPAAEKLVSEVLEKGYDHELGGHYKNYNRITGEMLMWGNPDILKTGWAMEQALTSGLQLWYFTHAGCLEDKRNSIGSYLRFNNAVCFNGQIFLCLLFR
ncbi:hypothetical protein ACFL3Q_03220 [Planctomycetota bacterium]